MKVSREKSLSMSKFRFGFLFFYFFLKQGFSTHECAIFVARFISAHRARLSQGRFDRNCFIHFEVRNLCARVNEGRLKLKTLTTAFGN